MRQYPYNNDQCPDHCNELKERPKSNGCCCGSFSCFKDNSTKESSRHRAPPTRGDRRSNRQLHATNSERLLYSYPQYANPPCINMVSLPYDNYENVDEGRFTVGSTNKYNSLGSIEYLKSQQETLPQGYYNSDAVETSTLPYADKKEINWPQYSGNTLRSSKESVSNRQLLDQEDHSVLKDSILKVSVTMHEALEKVFSENLSLLKEDSIGTGSGTVKMLESVAKVITENMLTFHREEPLESASDTNIEKKQINWAFLTGSTRRSGRTEPSIKGFISGSSTEQVPTKWATTTMDYLEFHSPSCKCDGPNCRSCNTKMGNDH